MIFTPHKYKYITWNINSFNYFILSLDVDGKTFYFDTKYYMIFKERK